MRGPRVARLRLGPQAGVTDDLRHPLGCQRVRIGARHFAYGHRRRFVLRNVALIEALRIEGIKMDESPPDLGDLEREVMQLVWANGPVTAESVREQLAR